LAGFNEPGICPLQDLNYAICAERGSDADLARIERAHRELDAAGVDLTERNITSALSRRHGEAMAAADASREHDA
jgi:hypothetical protein